MTKRAADTARRGRKEIEPSARPCATGASCVEELTPFLEPWDVARRLASLPHLLLLESTVAHPTLGRYSFVAADPFHWLHARGQSLVETGAEPRQADPFAVLRERLSRWRVETIAELPPFQGGAAG